MVPVENQGNPLRPPSSIPTRLLFIAWIVVSVIIASSFVDIMLHGSNPENSKMMGDLGAVWGGLGGFLISPGWKAFKRWPAPRKKFALSAVVISTLFAGVYFLVRARQTAKLDALFKADQELDRNSAPKKQHFMQLLKEKENIKDLSEYLQWCVELEPAINDYEAVERQGDNLLDQMQQEIGALKPRAGYGRLLPGFAVLRAVVAKDIEGEEAYRREIEYAKQLPGISIADRVQFYNANIQPIVEVESKIARDEVGILKDAKARGVKIPESVYQDAGMAAGTTQKAAQETKPETKPSSVSSLASPPTACTTIYYDRQGNRISPDKTYDDAEIQAAVRAYPNYTAKQIEDSYKARGYVKSTKTVCSPAHTPTFSEWEASRQGK